MTRLLRSEKLELLQLVKDTKSLQQMFTTKNSSYTLLDEIVKNLTAAAEQKTIEGAMTPTSTALTLAQTFVEQYQVQDSMISILGLAKNLKMEIALINGSFVQTFCS
jgi:hypothetical protein